MKTDKSVKRFGKAITGTLLTFKSTEVEYLVKNVIDLEDISEVEIQTEIENYIITDGLPFESEG